MAEPLVIEDGMARASERPGHGVELDWEGLFSKHLIGR
jgi:L-alanine-DL-glutamate epimerase-like enolase superfamily enzyme